MANDRDRSQNEEAIIEPKEEDTMGRADEEETDDELEDVEEVDDEEEEVDEE